MTDQTYSKCVIYCENLSPLRWLTSCCCKTGKFRFLRLRERLGTPFSGNWQWDNSWKDVFFTTPSVCQVWGGKVGYDEVEGELGWIVMSISVSLKDEDVHPLQVCLLPLTQTDMRQEEQVKGVILHTPHHIRQYTCNFLQWKAINKDVCQNDGVIGT